MKSLITLNKDKINNTEIHCKYLIIHSAQGCSGTIYNITSLGLWPDCLGPIEFIAWVCNTVVRQDRQVIDSYLRTPESLTFCKIMLLFTKAALYPQLFKEPECWFSWGLNRQPLPQHTSTNPIELIGQLEVMSLSILPISLVAVGSPFITHLNILNIWLCCHYFHLPFTDHALSMYNIIH